MSGHVGACGWAPGTPPMTHTPRFVSGIFGPYVQCSCSWRWAADDVRTLQIAFGHHRVAANWRVA